jgi:hypothetical protein
MKAVRAPSIISAVLVCFIVMPVYAQWEYGGILVGGPSWPTDDQHSCADGDSGILVAWEDLREPNSDIYIQKVDTAGYIRWAENGVRIDFSQAGQYGPIVVSDNIGGAIIGTTDYGRVNPPLNYDVYAHRIDNMGNRVWSDTGIAIINTYNWEVLYEMVSDGHGGAIFLWQEPATVQRIDSNGNLIFGPEGLRLTVDIDVQLWGWLVMTTDSSFIAVWEDMRVIDPGPGFYAQKFTLDGRILWDSTGVPVAVDPAFPFHDRFEISAAPNGGLFAIWENSYSGIEGISMQWIDGQGQPRWGPGGLPITQGYWHSTPRIKLNYDGEAIICWIESTPYRGFLNIIDTTGTMYWHDHLLISNSISRIRGITQSIEGEFEIACRKTDMEIIDRIIKYDMVDGFVWGDSGVGIGLPFPPCLDLIPVSDKAGGVYGSWKRWEDAYVVINRVYPDGWVAPDTTTNTEGDLIVPIGLNMLNYPNPFNSQTELRVHLSNLEPINIDLYDILGRKIETLYNDLPTTFDLNTVIDLSSSNYASGVYYIALTQKDKLYVLKITLLK